MTKRVNHVALKILARDRDAGLCDGPVGVGIEVRPNLPLALSENPLFHDSATYPVSPSNPGEDIFAAL